MKNDKHSLASLKLDVKGESSDALETARSTAYTPRPRDMGGSGMSDSLPGRSAELRTGSIVIRDHHPSQGSSS